MRALIISPTPSHPSDQGNRVRVRQIADSLVSRGFIVDFFYYAIDGLESDAVLQMRKAWDGLHCVGTDYYQMRQTYADTWGLDDWVSPSALQGVRHLADAYDYDLVVCNYVWCSALLEPFIGTRTRCVIDAHDAFGDRSKKIRAAGMTTHWYHTTVAEEGRGFDRADLVLAIQDHEGKVFRQQTQRPVRVVEFAMPATPLPLPKAGRIRVGYFGSGNPWNVRSVELFDALLATSLDRAELSQRFDFVLYGGICRSNLACEVFQSGGTVENAQDFYEDVDLVVNPMVGGTGLKIKTVEALAYGRAIVSTAEGGAGLEHIHPDICLPDIEAVLSRLRKISSRNDVALLAKEMQKKYAAYCSATERKIDAMLAELELVDQGASGFIPRLTARLFADGKVGGR